MFFMKIGTIFNIWLNNIVLSIATAKVCVSDELLANVTNNKICISSFVDPCLSVFSYKVYFLCVVSTFSQNLYKMPFGDSSFRVWLFIKHLNFVKINLFNCNYHWIYQLNTHFLNFPFEQLRFKVIFTIMKVILQFISQLYVNSFDCPS